MKIPMEVLPFWVRPMLLGIYGSGGAPETMDKKDKPIFPFPVAVFYCIPQCHAFESNTGVGENGEFVKIQWGHAKAPLIIPKD